MSDITIVLTGMVNDKYTAIESCCYGLWNSPRFPPEAAVIYSELKEEGVKIDFYDGNIIDEGRILVELSKKMPDTILAYLHTPYIGFKADFLLKLSRHCKELILVAVPFFWKDRILNDYNFISEVIKDENKFFGITTNDTLIYYEDLNVGKYIEGGKRKIFPILFTKFCPYGCTYCNVRHTKLRERKVEVLLEEITRLNQIYGITNFYIQDNQVTQKKKRFKELCYGFQDLEIDFKWSSDGRINETDDEVVRMLKESKCERLLYGVESANQEILNKINKNIKLEDVFKVAAIHHDLKMDFALSFMFGFPWDSIQTLTEMWEMIKRTKSTGALPGPVAAYPTTPLFEEMSKLGLVNEEDLDYINFSLEKIVTDPIPTLYLTKEKITQLYKEIEKKMFMLRLTRPKMLKSVVMGEIDNFGITGIFQLAFRSIKKYIVP